MNGKKGEYVMEINVKINENLHILDKKKMCGDITFTFLMKHFPPISKLNEYVNTKYV
jgi:hypothetical protein